MKKVLIVLSREILQKELEDKAGILPLAIPPFSREVALEFWVKNGLPMEEFDTLAGEMYAIPSTLVLRVGMWRFRQAFQAAQKKTPEQPKSRNTMRDLVMEFLDFLTEPMKRVLRFGSIPNAFTPELINKMTGEEADIMDILETLQRHYFINKGQGDWYYYSSDVREILRAFWRQPEQFQEFQKANRIAIAYFDDLANQTSPPTIYFYQREALYHRLLEDENAGLEYLADLFERACDQRQIGAAQNFSNRLTQTLPQLSPIAAQYASYYVMRLDFLLNQRKKLEDKINTSANYEVETGSKTG